MEANHVPAEMKYRVSRKHSLACIYQSRPHRYPIENPLISSIPIDSSAFEIQSGGFHPSSAVTSAAKKSPIIISSLVSYQ